MTMRSNQIRLWFSSLAYVLVHAVRRLGLGGSSLEQARVGTIRLKLFKIGVSWGGHESLVVPVMASIEQTPAMNSLSRFGVSARTIRFNVGLESVEDLWADVAQAFEKAKKIMSSKWE